MAASAQDVIVKKNGNTVVCRVIEVGQTEIVYKRWTELQGNNYVMNISDIASIHYENGGKKDFGTDTATNNSFTLNNMPRNIDAPTLLAMTNKNKESLITKLKRIEWIGGAVLLGIGIPCLGLGISAGYTDANTIMLITSGTILSAGGLALTTEYLIKTHRLSKQPPYNVQSIPIWKNEFKLNNNSKLSTDICTINDGRLKTSTIGFDINYNF